MLQAKGYKTLEAVTGEDGVKLAKENKPDLVLMDIQLPGINGIEAFKQIRGDAATKGIPVIADRLSDANRPYRDYRRRFRRLSRQADQPQGVPRDGKTTAGEVEHMTQHRILVVDDTPANVKLLSDLLSVKGYQVSTAVNGEQALDKVAKENPTSCCST